MTQRDAGWRGTRRCYLLLAGLTAAVIGAGCVDVAGLKTGQAPQTTPSPDSSVDHPSAAAPGPGQTPPPETRRPPLEVARAALESAEYDRARTELQNALALSPGDPGAEALQRQLAETLGIDFAFHYMPRRRQPVKADALAGELVLTFEDTYYLRIQAQEDLYLYVFKVDSDGAAEQLFPNRDYSPIANPITQGPLTIPDAGRWFEVESRPGTVTLYAIASRWRQRQLEAVCDEALRGARNGGKEAADAITAWFDSQKHAADSLPGLVWARHRFARSVTGAPGRSGTRPRTEHHAAPLAFSRNAGAVDLRRFCVVAKKIAPAVLAAGGGQSEGGSSSEDETVYGVCGIARWDPRMDATWVWESAVQ
jgi:hypothetical protein